MYSLLINSLFFLLAVAPVFTGGDRSANGFVEVHPLQAQERSLSVNSLHAAVAKPEPVVHNIHVTYATLGIDGKIAAARIKYFKHDLEKAVGLFARVDSISLGADERSDELFLSYLDSTFVLEQDGVQLESRLVGSGEEGEMWWYQVLYEAPKAIGDLQVTNRQLTEIFRDQKNILKAQRLSTGDRKSYYYNRTVVRYVVKLK